MRVLSGLALDRPTHKKASQRAVGYRHARGIGRCEIAQWGCGRQWAHQNQPPDGTRPLRRR
jgi:hypothetical protein